MLNLLSGKGAKLPVAVFTQNFEPISVTPISTLPTQAPALRPLLGPHVSGQADEQQGD
jgi:hypothetical protein